MESHPCEFFLNNGDGTFTDIAKELGLDLRTYAKGGSLCNVLYVLIPRGLNPLKGFSKNVY